MKNRFLNMVTRAFAPVALVVAMAAFSPVTALAANHGGGGGHSFSGGRGVSGGGGRGVSGGGRSFAAPSRGNVGGGRSFAAPARGFNGGVGGGRAYYGGRGYYGGGAYYGGRGYYGPGFGFGLYAPYGYAAPVCNPAGFYDAYGVWQYYPGCAVPYGY